MAELEREIGRVERNGGSFASARAALAITAFISRNALTVKTIKWLHMGMSATHKVLIKKKVSVYPDGVR